MTCNAMLLWLVLSLVLLGFVEASNISRQALFVSGQGGYPRVRIPVIVLTKKGTLLAFGGGWKGHVDNRSQMVPGRFVCDVQ